MARHRHLAVLHLVHARHVGHLVQVELLCHLRAHLGRVAVNGLTASDDDIGHTDLADSLAEGVARGQRVGTGKGAVSEQISVVGPAEKALADHIRGTRRSHRQDRNRRSGMLFFQSQRLFQRIEVLGVENGRQSGTVHRSLRRHGIRPHVSGVGYLLGKYYNFQTHISLLYI